MQRFLAIFFLVALIIGVSAGIDTASALPLEDGAATAAEFVLGPTTPGKWGPAEMGTGATITWSLMPDKVKYAEGSDSGKIRALEHFMPEGYLAEIQSAFDAWAAVANLTFEKVTDWGEPFNAPQLSGDIRLGGHDFDGPGGALAHGFFPPYNGVSAAGDIHFDAEEEWVIGFDDDPNTFDIFQVVVHEIGHSLGLDHVTSVVAVMNPYYSEDFRGLLESDIAGAQYLYGPSPSIASSDVPEPSTLVLLGAGFVGLLFIRRRRLKL